MAKALTEVFYPFVWANRERVPLSNGALALNLAKQVQHQRREP